MSIKIGLAAAVAASTLAACSPQEPEETIIQRASCHDESGRSARIHESVDTLTLAMQDATGRTVYTESSVHASTNAMRERLGELEALGDRYCETDTTGNENLRSQSTSDNSLLMGALEYECLGTNGNKATARNLGVRGIELSTSDGNVRDDIRTMAEGRERAVAFCTGPYIAPPS